MIGEFLYPDSLPYTPFEDYEYGGVAHQDPSKGLMVKVWKASKVDGWIEVVPVDGSQPPIRFVQVPETANYVSMAFDRNMRVALSWHAGGTSFLFWYNSLTDEYTTTTFPGCFSPRLAHDDKRDLQNALSDVVFVYLRDETLYVRNQRERYGVEHVLGPVPVGYYLRRVGMNNRYRLQFELL